MKGNRKPAPAATGRPQTHLTVVPPPSVEPEPEPGPTPEPGAPPEVFRHHQAAVHPGAGLLPSECPGRLVLQSEHDDRVWAGGAWRDSAVRVYLCIGCDRILSRRDGLTVNDYPMPTHQDAPRSPLIAP